MKKLILLILFLLLITSCEIEYEKAIYSVDDIVIIKPDSSTDKILDYTTWSDHTKYTVEYLDTTKKSIILEEEIINYKNN